MHREHRATRTRRAPDRGCRRWPAPSPRTAAGCDPGVLTTTRPPGASTRCSSASAPARSSMNMSPIWQSADVVGLVGQWQRRGVGLVPLMGAPPAGMARATASMSGADVDAGHRAGRADLLGGGPGDDPGAAGDVEHPLAGPERAVREELDRDGRGDRGHEEALVELGCGCRCIAVGRAGHGVSSRMSLVGRLAWVASRPDPYALRFARRIAQIRPSGTDGSAASPDGADAPSAVGHGTIGAVPTAGRARRRTRRPRRGC